MKEKDEKKKRREDASGGAQKQDTAGSGSWFAKNGGAVLAFAVGVIAVLLLVLFVADWAGSNAWFTIIPRFLEGLFSFAAFGAPFLLMYCAFVLPKLAKDKKYRWNVVMALTLIVTVSVMAGLILNRGDVTHPLGEYKKGKEIAGGGIVGGYLSWLFSHALSMVGAWILTVAVAAVQVIYLVNLTMKEVGAFFGAQFRKLGSKIAAFCSDLWMKITKKDKRVKVAAGANGGPATSPDDGGDDTFVPPPPPEKGTKYHHKPIDDNPYVEGGPDAGFTDGNDGAAGVGSPFDDSGYPGIPVPIREDPPEGWGEPTGAGRGKSAPADDASDKTGQGAAPSVGAEKGGILPIDDIDPDDPIIAAGVGGEGDLRRVPRMTAEVGEEKAEVRAYTFPPIDLLTSGPSRHADVSDEELQANADRLVDTLRSFRVPTKVVNISRGPTITRYELQPEVGVRVRQIANLVDDISLNLAASGVRIEAPIPGMSAVGVEVPNKTRETVYLRSLIEDKRFEQMSAKLTAAIGVDVAGGPVFVDLAKMPHLLIAGTTGSGKSVCLNCLILSILYKASPDEVKMIMIDPKKVEFNVYNGLPHLIIPVVSNSKKAAGALAWAVNEMERRYEEIEMVGVRDIASYNKATAKDPEKEFMPQLVIIIDELADLMLTAPGEVEESICRIAQKGRACGMHLIIGTQRPSVDVITGLIKANVPSRVAFTVSSQVDSRTIIDIAGAEKLVGRGDMLFAPIGYMKPVRLQGAFVSDEEVERVATFIIEHSAEAIYDEGIIKDIEKEAEMCGNKGKKAAASVDSEAIGSDGDADPMLKAAIDLAVEMGKISTSLIQRRLSLGYGRAAKLIDEMEKRGIVSPPEGQKPRTVLITAAEWSEMCMRAEN